MACEIGQLPTEVAGWQLLRLARARNTFTEMQSDSRLSHDVLEFVFQPDDQSEFRISLAFLNGSVYVMERGHHFPIGFLPLISLLREPDLLVSILPPALAWPIQTFCRLHMFAGNDWLYHCRLRGFGPIPGVEAIASCLLYDVADMPCADGSILLAVETPPDGASSFRGVCLPEHTHGFQRVGDLGLVAYLGPSASSHQAAHCVGGDRLNFTMVGKVRMPISRWLLPNALVRWFVNFVFQLGFPFIIKLNAAFEGSELHERIREDSDGFYSALLHRLPAMRAPASVPPSSDSRAGSSTGGPHVTDSCESSHVSAEPNTGLLTRLQTTWSACLPRSPHWHEPGRES